MATNVVGFKELMLKLNRVALDAPVATAFGAYEGMQEIMLEARQQAPKDTEAMAKSGYVAPPEVRQSSSVHIEAGFGGESEEYVVRVHEDLTMNHPNGGNAKFFSNAVDAGRGQLVSTIGRHVKHFLATGRTTPVPKKVPAGPYEQIVAEVGG